MFYECLEEITQAKLHYGTTKTWIYKYTVVQAVLMTKEGKQKQDEPSPPPPLLKLLHLGNPSRQGSHRICQVKKDGARLGPVPRKLFQFGSITHRRLRVPGSIFFRAAAPQPGTAVQF